MKIIIETVPHKSQRYETCGDYFFSGDDITIKVSDTGDKRYNMLVAFHELAEALLTSHRGIQEEWITAFDEAFEAKRENGNTDEPGDSILAPYKAEHFFATTIERLLAREYGVDWNEYEECINSL